MNISCNGVKIIYLIKPIISDPCRRSSNLTTYGLYYIMGFLSCLKRAIESSQVTLDSVLTKASFWKVHINESFNARQRLLINRLLDGFEGKLNSSKWAKIAKCSQDTALRDINDLLDRRIFKRDKSGGRSTHYFLNNPE